MAAASVEYLVAEAEKGPTGAAAFIGLREGKLTITSFDEVSRLMDLENKRPKEQWWRQLAPIAQLLAAPGPPTA
jgi:6-phosphofructokinase 1